MIGLLYTVLYIYNEWDVTVYCIHNDWAVIYCTVYMYIMNGMLPYTVYIMIGLLYIQFDEVDAKPVARSFRWFFNSSGGSFEIPSAKPLMSFMNYAESNGGNHT